MNLKDREIIKNERDYMIKNISFDNVKPYLLEHRLFNEYMWKDINSMSDVLEFLPYRGPTAFKNWIEILQKAGYNKEASSLKIAPNKTIDVNSYYRMLSKPLGYCLIINNVDFQTKRIYGTDVDTEFLRNFFEKAEYMVTVVENLTAEEMKTCLKEFSRKDFKIVDSMILIILSYGNQSAVYGTDGKPISKETIWDYFNNRNCLALQNKPKVFFFVSFGSQVVNHQVQKTFPQESIDAGPVTLMPTCSDILLFHFTFLNDYSEVNTERGSLISQILIPILNEFYLKYDLDTLIKIFNGRLDGIMSVTVHSDNLGVRKKVILCRNE